MMRKSPSMFTSLLATLATNNKHSLNYNNVMSSSLASIPTTSTSTSIDTPQDTDPPPILRGVIFDMDGTLTKPNLDFGEMYRRCGVDPSQDILKHVAQLSDDEKERDRIVAIIEEMEEEGRQTMELLPGAMELIQWLQSHQIPMALVTRNTYPTTAVLSQKLDYTFSPLIARDDDRYPPKPNPTALHAIAQEWQISLPSESLLMVGDSFTNDVMFGKNAGIRTALLVHDQGDRGLPHGGTTEPPDFVTSTLCQLAFQLWQNYRLAASPLGQSTLAKVPSPQPTTDLAKAAATGDLATLQQLLLSSSSSLQEKTVRLEDSTTMGITVNQIDPDNGNTPLIWAVEYNHTMVVKYLLQNHGTTIHVNHRGYLGNTALARAARHGFLPILQLLLETSNNNNNNNHDQQCRVDLNLSNDKLQYPLHFAAFQQHVHVVQSLLEAGANPLVLDRKGRTPAQDTSHPTIQTMLHTAEKKRTCI